MKRSFYIFCFTLLGILLQFLAHALFEMATIGLLLKDFKHYGLGLSWSQWYALHYVLSLVFLMAGIVYGFRWGVYWWQVMYVEHRYKKWKWW